MTTVNEKTVEEVKQESIDELVTIRTPPLVRLVSTLRKQIAKLEAEGNKLKRALLERTPNRTRLCYLTPNNEIVLLGDPPDEEEESEGHNCDEMGCGSMSHVILRKHLTIKQMEHLIAGECVGLSDNPMFKKSGHDLKIRK